MATGKTMKLQNDEILQLRHTSQNFINRFPDRTPLHHALERTLKQTKRAFEDFADQEAEYRVEAAMLKPDGSFMLTDKQDTVIDPKKASDLQKKMRALNRKEVEVEIYQATSFPPDLEAMWLQQFLGTVISEELYEKQSGLLKEILDTNHLV